MEKLHSVDQKRRAVLRLLTERHEVFCRQGSVVTTWRNYQGRRRGPYFRLAFRAGGRQQSFYLGVCPELAEEVRQVLGSLQAPLRERRRGERQRARLRAALRRQKRQWEAELKTIGLYAKGFEVRGYRRPPRREAEAGRARKRADHG